MTAADPPASFADVETLAAAPGHVVAPEAQELDLRVPEARAGAARVVARVLGRSRPLVFGEMQVISADDELAIHATATCTLP